MVWGWDIFRAIVNLLLGFGLIIAAGFVMFSDWQPSLENVTIFAFLGAGLAFVHEAERNLKR